jgi:putative transposase
MIMKSEEFNQWAEKLNLSKEAIEEIQIIRSSDPSRRVGGGVKNSSGIFPSKKMGVSIQYESSHVELPTVYMLEFDENVLEFYDQPPSLKLKKVGWRTPDYFVIEKDKAYWIECKTEEELIKLSQKQIPKYYLDKERTWHYTPGEEYSKKLGLNFFVVSSKELSPRLQRNLVYLKDYLKGKEPDPVSVKEIRKKIMSCPGITLQALSDLAGNEYTIDHINSLIALGIIYVDLFDSLLIEPETVRVYLSKEQKLSFFNMREQAKQKKTQKITVSFGSMLMWGDKPWKIINHDHKTIFLASEQGEHNSIPRDVFETYISEGYIVGIDIKNAMDNPKVKEIIEAATEEDYEIANRRYEILKKLERGEEISDIIVTDRTIRNWKRDFNKAKELYGNGFLGLVPNNKGRGNHKRKIPVKSIELMNKVIDESYKTIKLKTAKIVHQEYKKLCKESGIRNPATYQTFCKEINRRSQYELKNNREGSRAAYEFEEFHWVIDETTPSHGDRAFEIAHIDHTQVDVRLDIGNGKTKKPWCTFLIDAFSRRILAFYLSFDSPSKKTEMMIIRECVKKYNRLPQLVVVDGGKDFQSTYFDALLMRYEVTKKVRPPAKARYGNIIERLFGVANKSFFHNLQGNTQIMKNVRQVTKSVNPENHAVWTLGLLVERLEKWIDEIYDNKEHSALFDTPKNIFNQSLAKTGKRPDTYIPYNDDFILMTLPNPDRPERKVFPGKGFKLNYFNYFCEELKDPRVENKKVEVRYDPFNIGVAYAFVNKRWVKCYSSYYAFIKGKTEKELKQITEELLEKRKQYEKGNQLTDKMIAEFISETEEIEKSLWEDKISNRNKEQGSKIKPSVETNGYEIEPESEIDESEDTDLLLFGRVGDE